MNKITTLFLGICLSMFAIQAGAQVYIWGGPDDANSRFTDGANDWTVDGQSTGANGLEDDPDAVFMWEANGSASAGAFAGVNAAIVSPSLSDGAMVFNSDFMDNGGSQSGFGNGPAPAPQLGHLTSPEFSCDGHATVSVKFNQHLRHFGSGYSLEVTVDGGNSWTAFALNTVDEFASNRLILTNTLNFRDAVEVIDISSVAANQPAVQIRFTVTGNYYYWILDDVMVIETPETDFVLGDCLYSPSNFTSPKMSLSNDSFFFAAYIFNKSATVQKDIDLSVSIEDANGNVMNLESTTIDELGIGDTLQVNFDDAQAFMPDALPVGEYLLTYLVSSSAGNDINLTDNIYRRQFNISDKTYQKTMLPTGGIRPSGSADYGIASILVTGDEGAACLVTGMSSWVTQNRGDVVFSNPDNFLGGFLLELPEDYDDPYFNDFDFDQTGIDDNENFIVLGSGEEALEGKAGTAAIQVELFNDEDDQLPLCLKSNRTYLLLANLAGIEGTAFTRFNDQGIEFHQFENVFPKAQLTYLILNGEDWGGGFGANTSAPTMDMMMTIDTSQCKLTGVNNKDLTLPQTSITVSPNPTVEFVNVTMDYKEVNSGTLVLTNVDGKVLERRFFNDVQNATETFDVNHLTAGSYMMNIFSDLGNRAIPFIVK